MTEDALNTVVARLEECFAAVFPDLSKEDISQASLKTLAAWDSIATINLMATVEEEFGIRIDMASELGHLASFDAFVEYLHKRA